MPRLNRPETHLNRVRGDRREREATPQAVLGSRARSNLSLLFLEGIGERAEYKFIPETRYPVLRPSFTPVSCAIAPQKHHPSDFSLRSVSLATRSKQLFFWNYRVVIAERLNDTKQKLQNIRFFQIFVILFGSIINGFVQYYVKNKK